MVSASTISTALARKALRKRKTSGVTIALSAGVLNQPSRVAYRGVVDGAWATFWQSGMVASMNDRTRTQACADCWLAGVVVAAAVGLLLAAALAPAPPAVLPLVVLTGVGMPMVVAYRLPPAVSSLRAHRRLTAMRRDLAQLPETAHPFDR